MNYFVLVFIRILSLFIENVKVLQEIVRGGGGLDSQERMTGRGRLGLAGESERLWRSLFRSSESDGPRQWWP